MLLRLVSHMGYKWWDVDFRILRDKKVVCLRVPRRRATELMRDFSLSRSAMVIQLQQPTKKW